MENALIGECKRINSNTLSVQVHHLACILYDFDECRVSEEITFPVTGPEQKRPQNWQAALQSGSFK